MHLTNHKSQGSSSSVQTSFIPLFSQKQAKTNKNCLEAVNTFLRVSTVKMCYNPMHLTNHKSKRWSMRVQTTFIPIFSQKKLKPTKYCLEAINSSVSILMAKMCHNPMHLTNHKSQRWRMSVQKTFITIFSQKRVKPTNICVEAVNSFVSIPIIKMCHNPMHFD